MSLLDHFIGYCHFIRNKGPTSLEQILNGNRFFKKMHLKALPNNEFFSDLPTFIIVTVTYVTSINTQATLEDDDKIISVK